MLSVGHCHFLDGVWHRGGIEHCCQAHCDATMCDLVHLVGHEHEHVEQLDETEMLRDEEEIERVRTAHKFNILDPVFEHEKVCLYFHPICEAFFNRAC